MQSFVDRQFVGDDPGQPVPARRAAADHRRGRRPGRHGSLHAILDYADDINAGLVSTLGRRGWLPQAREHGWRLKAKNYLYQKDMLRWAAQRHDPEHAKSQSVQQLPPWINQAAQQNYGFAQNVAKQPLQQYQGQMVADVGPQTQQCWNTAATGGGRGPGPVQRRPGRLSRGAGPAAAAGDGGAARQHQPAAVHEPVHAERHQQDAADHAAAARRCSRTSSRTRPTRPMPSAAAGRASSRA